MNPILERFTGTAGLTDQVIASDLLIASKSRVWNYASALTETTSPQVRAVLRKHLEDAIEIHEQVFAYMMEKGWYNAYNPQQQIQLDLTNAEHALKIQ